MHRFPVNFIDLDLDTKYITYVYKYNQRKRPHHQQSLHPLNKSSLVQCSTGKAHQQEFLQLTFLKPNLF